ncbi:MAG: DUF932 domain-containing protein [Roseofilum sp. SBFL]|uniref:DUF932 domain-containing protein n=1 Tax=Roseofilum sp. SBFL TaxID=2821496 RepID=UPI001B13B609|nr:DUF932 domain-containing protein [Roseofilum sp. SBFL]MBP0043367.1 DUF932 domain-containing protein [Roseofilum sp. SBFL]
MIKTNCTPIPKNASAQEILDKANLNWRVKRSPRFFFHSGKFVEVPGKYSLLRTDRVEELTTAPENWQNSQNQDIVAVFHQFAQDAGITLTHAGPLNGGKQICLIGDLEKEYDVQKVGDITHCYLQLIGSHECGVGHQVRILAERLVCTNGATRKVVQHKQVLRHSPDVLQLLQQGLTLAVQEWEGLCEDHELLADTPMDQSQAAMLLIESFGYPEKGLEEQPPVVQTALQLFDGQLIGGHLLSVYKTAYGLLQSVTEYYGHHHRWRNSTDHFASLTIGSVANQVRRFERQLVGVSNHG